MKRDWQKKLFDYLKTNSSIEVHVNEKQLNTIVPFTVKNRDSKEIAEMLNSHYGIGVRAGSFCVYNVVRKLLNIKDETEIIKSVKGGDTSKIPTLIRASIALCNTEADIDRMIEAIKEITQ